MKKMLLFAFIGLITFSCTLEFPEDQYQEEFGLPREKVIDILVQQIAQYDKVDSEGINMGAITSLQYARFELLKEMATQDELLKFTQHYSPVVMSYAYWALMDNDFPRMDTLFQQALNTEAYAKYHSGCTIMGDFVYHNLYTRYFYKVAPIENKKYVTNIYDRPLWVMDSLVLYHDNVEQFIKSWVLENRKFSKEHLPRIRHLAFKELNFDAIQYLHHHHFAEHQEAIKQAALRYMQEGKINNYDHIFDFLLPFREPYINKALLAKYHTFEDDSWAKEDLKEILKKYKLL
ncbi:hypothetical protein BKI52_17470 [marine bacterium AO1-C]|nr:hypothetical protein BKI52_17470 [marine bacterium AO1-C]